MLRTTEMNLKLWYMNHNINQSRHFEHRLWNAKLTKTLYKNLYETKNPEKTHSRHFSRYLIHTILFTSANHIPPTLPMVQTEPKFKVMSVSYLISCAIYPFMLSCVTPPVYVLFRARNIAKHSKHTIPTVSTRSPQLLLQSTVNSNLAYNHG